MTTRFLLQSSSCTDNLRVLADAARGWKVAKESSERESLKRRAACVGSSRPTTVPEMAIVWEGPGLCITYFRAAANAKTRCFLCVHIVHNGSGVSLVQSWLSSEHAPDILLSARHIQRWWMGYLVSGLRCISFRVLD